MLVTKHSARERLQQLYDEYYDKIYVYIAHRVNNSNDTENLTSDVFMKAFANPYNTELAQFSTYIFTIAANTLKNYYLSASNSTEHVIALHSSNDKRELDLLNETDLLNDCITREEYGKLKTVLAALPDQQYDAVYRHYYLGESFKEIGAAICVSETNARQLHFEAMKKIREVF